MREKRKKFLVVDDIEINRTILFNLFNHRFDILEADNGQTALDLLNQYGSDIAVVLLDIVMPVMDGFGVLQTMNQTGAIETIPVILITSENDDESALQGYSMGVSDMIKKPFNSDIVERRVSNVVELYAHKQNLEEKLQEQKEMLETQAIRLRQFDQSVIDVLSTTVEFRNMESGMHVKRIRQLVQLLLEQLGEYYPLQQKDIELMSNVSALHDIGKISIPDSILLKPGPLLKEEFEIMKTHTIRGCEILETFSYAQEMGFARYSYDICRYHHERWDGRGYPDGLKGDEIPIWAQATSLADVYDALTNKRVYKEAYTHDEAVAMILRGECGMFNPKLLKCFMDIQMDPEFSHSASNS